MKKTNNKKPDKKSGFTLIEILVVIGMIALLAAIAFVLSMLADFTALPGALWMVFRDRPSRPGEVPPARN